MSQSTTRVFTLLELMQSHGLMSGPELARRLDVDPRTLRRFIHTLESLGSRSWPSVGAMAAIG